tara:strand:- start:4469 stop:5890 length:1422 start_codon:yes stop_codon:yes gene_type:complete
MSSTPQNTTGLARRFRGLSSSMRFALALSGIFTLAAILAAWISYNILSDELRARLFDDARLTATRLADLRETAGTADFLRQLDYRASSAAGENELVAFIALDRSVHGSFQPIQLFTGPKELAAGTDFVSRGKAGRNQGDIYFAYGLKIGEGWIYAARDSQWITDSQEVLAQSVGLGLGMALLASMLAGVMLARRNAARIERLNAVLAAAATGNLRSRFTDTTAVQDDIAMVAAGINRMLEDLQGNVDRIQQVTADIAHDLRAPLTRLHIRLEPEIQRDGLPDETRGALIKALGEIETIASTFDAILNLAQLEGGAAPVNLKQVDLGHVAGRVHEMLAPVAEDLGHTLELSLPMAPVHVQGDEDLLTQAVVNLVDNAFRYCPVATEVQIAVKREETRAIIAVSDNGPGIPTAEREKVTRRFYRMDSSRNTSGTGLGLNLVAAIARRLGGELKLSDNSPGLKAEIALQINPSDAR